MKTFVLMVAKTFPASHPRAGQPTNFEEKINSINCDLPFPPFNPKIHTIRANYELWKKRIDQVKAGKAFISVRQWEGKPYRSKQLECFRFYGDRIGIQKLEEDGMFYRIDGKYGKFNLLTFSKNDGLSFVDFIHWFPIKCKKKQITEPKRFENPMAIIHFTNFKY
jgi:hypothetical protein